MGFFNGVAKKIVKELFSRFEKPSLCYCCLSTNEISSSYGFYVDIIFSVGTSKRKMMEVCVILLSTPVVETSAQIKVLDSLTYGYSTKKLQNVQWQYVKSNLMVIFTKYVKEFAKHFYLLWEFVKQKIPILLQLWWYSHLQNG